MLANIRIKPDGEFVYSLQLNENKNIEATPLASLTTEGFRQSGIASTDSIRLNSSNSQEKFKNNFDLEYSDEDTDRTGKGSPVKMRISSVTESQQFKRWFRNSKIVNEDGTPKVMYHGTPNGIFTIFREGSYFSPNEEYARRYMHPSASSISTGKRASNPKKYEVYLSIQKPFDIENDRRARDIYINEYIKGGNALGINPYLSPSEYDKIRTVDWTEGEDLREFLQENGYDYDGIVLDEGADGGYGEEVKERGKSYVVFSPTQIKSATDNIGTFDGANPDIRYSLSDETPIAQGYTSAATSLPKQLPALFTDKNAVFVDGGTNVDIGAGDGIACQMVFFAL